jgi:siroheme synthase
MALNELGSLCERLLALGLDPQTPAAVISRGTCPDQEVVVAERELDRGCGRVPAGPALVVVGEVVGLRERLRGSRDDSQLYFSQPVG